jgi:hypothetical protein
MEEIDILNAVKARADIVKNLCDYANYKDAFSGPAPSIDDLLTQFAHMTALIETIREQRDAPTKDFITKTNARAEQLIAEAKERRMTFTGL